MAKKWKTPAKPVKSNKTEFAEAWFLEQNPNFVPGVAKLRGQARTRKAQRSKGITK